VSPEETYGVLAGANDIKKRGGSARGNRGKQPPWGSLREELAGRFGILGPKKVFSKRGGGKGLIMKK